MSATQAPERIVSDFRVFDGACALPWQLATRE